MKCFLALLLCFFPLIINAQELQLVWSDEFDYEGLPDSTKWNYETGLVRNNESQYYTDHRLENARVEDGKLIITARKEPYEGAEYTSASLNTKKTFNFTYGRIEVRARLPKGRGVWPAIWTLGSNIDSVGWPACGEIDIMEYVGSNPDTIYANVHTRDYNHNLGTGRGDKIRHEHASDEFHVFAVDWYHDQLIFSIEGVPYFACKDNGEGEGAWPFTKPQFLLINLAIGGSWGGQQGIDDSVFPVEYQIDYVRIYQWKE
ncbi:glycoside hydrolase family 16 protein [Prolixibacter denitrificans]|nr:glycoside hydrolase family 16 protein [Prolixibacter denitrificans]